MEADIHRQFKKKINQVSEKSWYVSSVSVEGNLIFRAALVESSCGDICPGVFADICPAKDIT